jgi:MFS family permease
MYSIAIAHTNDRLKPEQMAGASSTLVLVLGIGSILGPTISGYLLSTFNTIGYLIHIGVTHSIITASMIYYIFKRDAVIDEEQGHYQVVPARFTGVVMEAIAQEAEESIETEEE